MKYLNYRELLQFYKGKRVFITGHTGFKGTWLSKILLDAGAYVIGYSLPAPTNPALFELSGIRQNEHLTHLVGDIRDGKALLSAIEMAKPDIVFHLAAQPIVRESYRNPVDTYSTNVMGTVNILEALRMIVPNNEKEKNAVRYSFLNVTTDKVYKNNEWKYGYRENDELGGDDPYSNSKSCSELVTNSYKNSFFSSQDIDTVVRLSTARAGNVIGGGDFASERIIPDAIRAIMSAIRNDKQKAEILVRNPNSVRPYQHVLEALFAYLLIAAKQYEEPIYADCYNVGPEDNDCITTKELIKLFCAKWNSELQIQDFVGKENMDARVFPSLEWKYNSESDAPHEANLLKLETLKIKSIFGWGPRWHIQDAIEQTVCFFKVWLSGGDIGAEMKREIELYVCTE